VMEFQECRRGIYAPRMKLNRVCGLDGVMTVEWKQPCQQLLAVSRKHLTQAVRIERGR